MAKKQKIIVYTLQTALDKVRKYCVYQERSQQEVRNKLYSYGLTTTEVEQGIVVLIEENFVNEERFAITYARGKFKIKNWGKIKIKAGLKAKMIAPWCINKALSQIDDHEYFATMKKVLQSRARKEKETNPLKRNYLIVKYVASQGFEPEFIWDLVKSEQE
jgi:regulatory protein